MSLCLGGYSLAADVDAYAGRYGQGITVVTFTAVSGRLYVQPVEWSGRQPLDPVSPDVFQMHNRPARTFRFGRGPRGAARVAIEGMDVNGAFSRLRPRKRPVELLAEGSGRAALAAFRAAGTPYADALALARRLFDQRVSTRPAFLAFMEAARAAGHRDAATLESLGAARIAAGDRAGGRAALAEAVRAGAGGAAVESLSMLDADSGGQWTASFPLASLYAPPTSAEIRAVEAAWAARDLSPRDVRVEDRFHADGTGGPFDIEIVSHLVHGSRHHGAILVPRGAARATLPVLVEVKGVSWSFFPLAVPEGSTALEVLGDDARGFVIALPGLRGETLRADGKTYVSEGDPAESWDGAADDALAFLNVVLERVAAADPARVAVFGRSRGGTVALLAGARDPRIRRVLAWSAPAGWIEDMPYRGFTQREVVGEGVRRRSGPNMIGGQSIRTFVRRALQGLETLEQARLRLIASSPVYFVERLPVTEAHWGVDDPIVEPANGERIRRAAQASAGARGRVTVRFHVQGGHDLDPAVARPMSREFLLGDAALPLSTTGGLEP